MWVAYDEANRKQFNLQFQLMLWKSWMFIPADVKVKSNSEANRKKYFPLFEACCHARLEYPSCNDASYFEI